MTTSAEVRQRMIEALRLDLIGPGNDLQDPNAREILPAPPSQYYLSGFLVPYHGSVAQRSDSLADDELDQVGFAAVDDDDQPERASSRRSFFPSSIGLSVLVPASTSQLRVEVQWGEYQPLEEPKGPQGLQPWQRYPREAEVFVTLIEDGRNHAHEVEGSDGLLLQVTTRPAAGSHLPSGTRAVAVFLVNNRLPQGGEGQAPDRAYIFQPRIQLRVLQYFVNRPDPRGNSGNEDEDEKLAALQYRNTTEFAVGHNVSAVATLNTSKGSPKCEQVATEWLPQALVEYVAPARVSGEFSILALAECESAAKLKQQLQPMLDQYADWIDQQAQSPMADHLKPTSHDLENRARKTHSRMLAGLDSMNDPLVFEAFRLANRAIYNVLTRKEVKDPQWRPFQLAFMLTNLAGLVDPDHPDREVVDLLFFPTGGGKTEAYLGIAAFTLFLRRLRSPDILSAGVTVLMRYTLRLLTLDQLGRAAGLICAMELLRQAQPERLGQLPFEIGLWVGKSATPNRMGKKGDNNPESARSRTLAFQRHSGYKQSPIPLEACPWCGKAFSPTSFQLKPNPDTPTDLTVGCANYECDFSFARGPGLPILAVDEPIYRRLPAFVIATIDKYAAMPWVGETCGLFGRVDRYDRDGFYNSEICGKKGRELPGPLRPPELIIQDELHLISGPLGTMAGLYETAVDYLCHHQGSRPKIIASTATVRRASKQIRALFGRPHVEIFPPPGPDRRDSFFARTLCPQEQNPRIYLGVAAQGRSLKVALLRSYLALCSAAQQQWNLAGKRKDNPADPYMTLLGYFNTLRELGGSRRIVEDEVRSRLVDYAMRRQRLHHPQNLLADRPNLREPGELTSRVPTNQIATTRNRLEQSYDHADHLDIALATNMISVGLDITRLGLMVVLGQPKTAAEYIQSTSRVGRDPQRPGLIITLLNLHRPRDRSHYERFSSWHESFYRAVEATSVTPFSPRAVDRGLAAVTVALARHGLAAMTGPKGAYNISWLHQQLDFVAREISRRAEAHDKDLSAQQSETLRRQIAARVFDLIESWKKLADPMAGQQNLQYQQEVGGAPPLLRSPLETGLTPDQRKFRAHWSLRDVEPVVNLRVKTPEGFEEGPL